MVEAFIIDKDVVNSYSGQVAFEPVTLAEAKDECRVTFTDDDTAIAKLISSCRAVIENFCHVSMIEKTVTITLNLVNNISTRYGSYTPRSSNCVELELPEGPVKSITNVTSIGTNGVARILTEGTDYFIKGSLFKIIDLSLLYGQIIIIYTTGYITVPEDLKLAILNEIAYRYDHKGEEANIRASEFTQQGVCEPARILAQPYQRLAWL